MRIAQQFTACDAFQAHHASGKASAQCVRIVAFIRDRGGDWSIGEIAHALGLEKSTVSARMNELVEAGTPAVKCRRRDRRSGITVRAVGLPVVGQGRLFK